MRLVKPHCTGKPTALELFPCLLREDNIGNQLFNLLLGKLSQQFNRIKVPGLLSRHLGWICPIDCAADARHGVSKFLQPFLIDAGGRRPPGEDVQFRVSATSLEAFHHWQKLVPLNQVPQLQRVLNPEPKIAAQLDFWVTEIGRQLQFPEKQQWLVH